MCFALVLKAGQAHDLDAFPVGRQRKGDRIGRILGAHEAGRQGDDLIGVRGDRVADLGAADDDAVFTDFDDAQVLVRIGLFVTDAGRGRL